MSKQPPILMRKHGGKLTPVTAYDAERIDALSSQQDVEVTVHQRRSNPQHRLYWATLGEVVKATDRWSTSQHLHDAIKIELGYFTVCFGFDGKPFALPNSTAYKSMSQPEFQAYFDKAMALIAAEIGADPLTLQRAAA